MNRRFFLTRLGLGLFASISLRAIAAWANKRQDLVFYVAVNGNDLWSGRLKSPNSNQQDGPFASLFRAREAIRQLKRQQGLNQPIVVYLRGGTYFLSQPFKLTPEDSGTATCPITYRAYPGENPIISGGRLIDNWRQQGQLAVATLPQVKTGAWYFRLLRVGNDWAVRARYPNYDSNPSKGWLFSQQRSYDRPQGALNNHLAYITQPGDRITWEIEAAKAGTYQIWLRYARKHTYAGSMSDRTAISINGGQRVTIGNLANTAGWDEFRWDMGGTIVLPAGKSTLLWENVLGGSINLDAFCLTDDAAWQPTSGKDRGNLYIRGVSPGKQQIIIQAETYSKIDVQKFEVVSSQRYRIPLAPSEFPQWSDWSGAEVNAFFEYDYGNAIFPITEVDQQDQCLLGDFTQSSYSVAPGNRFYIENVRGALDSPDEWYLDRDAGELWYWGQAEDLAEMEIVAPTMDKLIVFEGDRTKNSYVEYLKFQDLSFKDTDYTIAENYFQPQDSAIWLKFTRHCTIESCGFTGLGGYAIRVANLSHHNRLVSNQIEDLGQGGIILASEDNDSQPQHNLIAANSISGCGRVYKHVAGIYVATGSHNQIVHNYLKNLPRYGISLKSFSLYNRSHHNVLEFNHLENMCLETADTGAIETLGRDREPSYNMIRYNLIRHTVGRGTTPQGEIITPYYSWGIYLDDFSSKTTIYGNIVIGTVLGSIIIHGGKDNLIENNILVNGKINQIQLSPEDDFMRNNVIRRNAIVYDRADAQTIAAAKLHWHRDILAECDFNLYWGGNLQNPESAAVIFPEDSSLTQWQAAGFDRHSVVANPQIADLEGNCRLLPHSPAYKMGFKPIPTQSIGIDGYKSK